MTTTMTGPDLAQDRSAELPYDSCSQPPATRARPRHWLIVTALGVALLCASGVALSTGSVRIPLVDVLAVLLDHPTAQPRWSIIVVDIRLPALVTAVVVGAALSVAGLQMQTLFRNALAEPYILGASSGASLGVAGVVLGGGMLGGTFLGGLVAMGKVGVVLAAALGSGAVLALVLLLSRWVRNSTTLLLVGVMTGSITSAVVSLLVAYADPAVIQVFLVWGMGSFNGTSWQDLQVVVPVLVAGLLVAAGCIRALNALLLGEGYAASMGINVRFARFAILSSAALLTGAATAYCGPIGFLGLVVPHLCRVAFGTSNHRILLPGVCLMGALLAVVCAMVAGLPGRDGTLPLNAVTAVVGAPVVIAVLIRGRGMGMQGAS